MRKHILHFNTQPIELRHLYDGSALTWEGLVTDRESMDSVVDWLEEIGAMPRKPLDFYITFGKMMNEVYGLTGSNAYPDQLRIVSVKLTDLGMAHKLTTKRFEVGARWFDDIVDNNAMREGLDKDEL